MKRILSLTIISAIALFADAQDVIISDLTHIAAFHPSNVKIPIF